VIRASATNLWETCHDQILRKTIASRGGEIFKHTGDGCCAVFPSAAGAVEAAVAAQQSRNSSVCFRLAQELIDVTEAAASVDNVSPIAQLLVEWRHTVEVQAHLFPRPAAEDPTWSSGNSR
jgi:hypothetical protein